MPRRAATSPLDALRQTWGFAGFRPGQREAVEAVCAGRDVLAVLPTGGGKSLVYQVPALVRPGVALVISPLIALMQDQVEALHARGVRAAAAHAGLAAHQMEQLWTDAEFGRYDVVYLTPERLHTDLFRARVPRLSVSLLAVDEAHCISEWGHDFRPAYREIADVRPLLSTSPASASPGGPESASPPLVAVTATATPEVRRDILSQLALRDPEVVVSGFDRPNLIWSVHHVQDKARQVRAVFEGVEGAGLVYAGTRRATEEWARTLQGGGVSAEAYHAGMNADARIAAQRRWLAGQTRVMVATSAFGMGIDKPDVRAVVHVALPPTLEAYVQEAGRAGRDGQRAYCALVLAPDDDALPRAMASGAHPTPEIVQRVYEAVGSLAGVATGAQADGPTPVDVATVSTAADVRTSVARSAIEHLARQGTWDVRHPRGDRVMVRVLYPPARLRAYADAQPAGLAAFVRALVRVLPAEAFSDWASLWLPRLTKTLRLPPARVLAGLDFLSERGILATIAPASGVLLNWSGPRAAHASVDAAALAQSRTRSIAGVERVVRYAESVGCRRQHILAYFGERAPSRCGRCDVCIGRHRPATVTPEDEADLQAILVHVEQGDSREHWLPGLPPRRRDTLADWLLSEGLLDLTDPLADTYALTPSGLKALKRVVRAGGDA